MSIPTIKWKVRWSLIVLTETWWTEADAAQFSFPRQGYNRHFYACRKKGRDHGGVSIFVREGIKVEQVAKQIQPEILVLSLGEKDLLVMAVYASPKKHKKVFETISELLSKLPQHANVLLVGDFNAHVQEGYRTLEPFQVEDPIGLFESEERARIRPRRSMDTTEVCVRGAQCLALCNRHTLDILNGCVLGDYSGSFTYHSKSEDAVESVLDLCICSAHMFDKVKWLIVTRNDVSDHSMLELAIDMTLQKDPPKPRGQRNRKTVWVQENWKVYAEVLHDEMKSLKRRWEALPPMEGLEGVDRRSKWLLKQCAALSHKAFGAESRGDRGRTTRRNHEKFPWWDEECETLRDALAREQEKANQTGVRTILRSMTKQFRRVIKHKRREGRVRADVRLLKSLKGLRPEEAWKVLNGKHRVCHLDDLEGGVSYFTGVYQVEQSEEIPGLHGSGEEDMVHEDVVGSLDEQLNKSITTEEVIWALHHSKNRKSTADGYCSELLKYAKQRDPDTKVWSHPLVPMICEILNVVFVQSVGIPDTWRQCFVVPVYKGKGDMKVWDSYRGVSIVTTWYKLLCSILNRRLEIATEQWGMRSIAQCGFRKRLGTISAIFVLYHTIHLTCSPQHMGGKGTSLFACFVDFRKAFDSVCRRLIWQRLHSLGIRGAMLHALKNLYEKTKFQVRINGRTSEGFVVTVSGVRQGCPISPLLFGVFIEQLHEFLKARCPEVCVLVVEEEALSDVFYADDVVLLAYNMAELQFLCNVLSEFCGKVGMAVNVAKTEMVIFRQAEDADGAFGEGPSQGLTYGESEISFKESFKYLGIPFHSTDWLKEVPHFLAARADRACMALKHKLKGKQICCPEVMMRYFLATVAPVGNYACQVWAVNFLSMDRMDQVFQNPLQKVVLDFIRFIVKVPNSTSRWVRLREFGLEPVQYFWVLMCAKFWNSNSQGQAGRISCGAFKGDIKLFCSGSNSCWTAKFLQCMCKLDLTQGMGEPALRGLGWDTLSRMVFSLENVKKAVLVKYDSFFNLNSSDPRLGSPGGLAIVRHRAWFRSSETRHLSIAAPLHCMRTLIRFRIGCMPLRIHMHGLKRKERTCKFCHLKLLEDEKHIVFECPVYQGLRDDAKWKHLYQNVGVDMLKFMNQEAQHDLAWFLVALFKYRQTCVPVPELAAEPAPVVAPVVAQVPEVTEEAVDNESELSWSVTSGLDMFISTSSASSRRSSVADPATLDSPIL